MRRRFVRVTPRAWRRSVIHSSSCCRQAKPMFPFISPESVYEAVEMAVVFFSVLTTMLGLLIARQA